MKKTGESIFQKAIDSMWLEWYKKEMIKFLLEKNFNPEEYENTLKNLKYLENNSEFLDIKNSFPISNWLYILLDHLEKEEYKYWIDKYGHLMVIKFPNKNKIIIEGDYWFNSSSLRKIFADKNYTTQILKNHWVRVPDEMLLMKKDDLYCEYIDNYENYIKAQIKNLWGYPVIVKPIDQSLWKWVQKIFNEDWLLEFLDYFNNEQKLSNLYVIQKFISGADHRILYLDWEIVVAYKRENVSIIWDGVDTIIDIIRESDFNISDKVVMEKYLKTRKIDINRILWKWEKIEVLPTANISTGWEASVVILSKEDIDFIKNIANIFWATYFWIDIITTWSIADWTVIEINGAPWIGWISKILPWFKEKFANIIWNKIKNT